MIIKYIILSYNTTSNEAIINAWLDDVYVLKDSLITCVSIINLETQIKDMIHIYIENQNKSNEIKNILNLERIIEIT